MKKHIPNAITAGNLFFGCLAIIATFDQNLKLAAIYIVLAAVLDFLDGFAARLLKVHSEIGKQLDSLADVISFGVAPGFIFYSILNLYVHFNESLSFLYYLPLTIAVFSAFRLAKFNIDTRQTDSFIGVPTPANALFICSIPFVIDGGPQFAEMLFTSFWFLILYPIIASWLLVAEIPLFALKFKNFSWQANKLKYIFLMSSILLLSIFKYFGISLSILLYVLLSILNNFLIRKK